MSFDTHSLNLMSLIVSHGMVRVVMVTEFDFAIFRSMMKGFYNVLGVYNVYKIFRSRSTIVLLFGT